MTREQKYGCLGWALIVCVAADFVLGAFALALGGPIVALIVVAPGLYFGFQLLPALHRRVDDDAWVDYLLKKSREASVAGDGRVVGACHRKIVLATNRHPERDWTTLHTLIDHHSPGCPTCDEYGWVDEDTVTV